MYLEEKQDLLYVGLDTPRTVRSACSELGLNDVDKDQSVDFLGDFPSRTASTQELGDSGNFRKISGESTGQKRLNADGGKTIWRNVSSDEEEELDEDEDEDPQGRQEDEDSETSCSEEEEDDDTDENESDDKDMDFLDRGDDVEDVKRDDKAKGAETRERKKAQVVGEDDFHQIKAMRKSEHEPQTFSYSEKRLDATLDRGYEEQSGDDLCMNHPNLSTTNALRSAGSARPSRGRTRVQRMRPAPIPPIETARDSLSPEKSLTDKAAAVTARLYQPRAPREDLKGSFLKGSRELISSPVVSPVLQRKEFSRDSPHRTLSSSSERDRESPPKHSFLKKGSKKQRTSPVHLPLSPSGRHKDHGTEAAPKFDYMRKGSRKSHLSTADKEKTDAQKEDVRTHDYLRRKAASDGQGTPKKRVTKEENIEKHPYLRRSDKNYTGLAHERLKRRSGDLSHDYSHSDQRSKSNHIRVKTSQETSLHDMDESVKKGPRSHLRKNFEEDSKKLKAQERRYHSEPPNIGSAAPGYQAIHHRHSPSDQVVKTETVTAKRHRKDRHKSQESINSTESLPKHKYLKKGSGKQPFFGPKSKRSQCEDPLTQHDMKAHPSQSHSQRKSAEIGEYPRQMTRSQSYPGPGSFPKLSVSRSRTRLLSSATSLASVPEMASEEEKCDQRPHRQILESWQQPGPTVSRRSDKPNTNPAEGEDRRRHSEPEGDQLASALAQYFEDIEGCMRRDRNSDNSSGCNVTCSAGNLVSPLFSQTPTKDEGNKLERPNVNVPTIVVSTYDSNPTSPRSSQEKQENSKRLPLKPKATNVRRNITNAPENFGTPAQELDSDVGNVASDVVESITKTIMESEPRDVKGYTSSEMKSIEDGKESPMSDNSSEDDSDVDISEDSLEGFQTRSSSSNPDYTPAMDSNASGNTADTDLDISDPEPEYGGPSDNDPVSAVVSVAVKREIQVACQVPEFDRDQTGPGTVDQLHADSDRDVSIITPARTEHLVDKPFQKPHSQANTPLRKTNLTQLHSFASSGNRNIPVKERSSVGKLGNWAKSEHSKQAGDPSHVNEKSARSDFYSTPSDNKKKRRPKSDSGRFPSPIRRGRRNPQPSGANGSVDPATSSSLSFHRAHSAPSRVESTYQAHYVDYSQAGLTPEVWSIRQRVRDLFAPSEDLMCTGRVPSPDRVITVQPPHSYKPSAGQLLASYEELDAPGLSERTKTLFRSSGNIPAYDRVPEFVNMEQCVSNPSIATKSPREETDSIHISPATRNFVKSVSTDQSWQVSQYIPDSVNQPEISGSGDGTSKPSRQGQITQPGKLIQIGPNTFKLVSQVSQGEWPMEHILTLDTDSTPAGPLTATDNADHTEETRWQSQLSEDDPVSSAQQQIQALQEVLQQLSPRWVVTRLLTLNDTFPLTTLLTTQSQAYQLLMTLFLSLLSLLPSHKRINS